MDLPLILVLRIMYILGNRCMGTKQCVIIGLILSMLIGIGATCKKPRICFDVITYNFINNEARAIPNKDSTKVGDTLWIEMNTPLVLQDVQTHIMVDYSKATTLGNTFQFLSFKGGSVDDPGVAYAADSFDIQMVNGHQETTTFPIE